MKKIFIIFMLCVSLYVQNTFWNDWYDQDNYYREKTFDLEGFYSKINQENDIDIILDALTSESKNFYNIGSYNPSYSDLQDTEFNKYKFDFLYYYGLYKSQTFLKAIWKSDVQDDVIDKNQNEAKIALKKLLEANLSDWLWLICVFVWESSKFFVNKELFPNMHEYVTFLPIAELTGAFFDKKIRITWLYEEVQKYYGNYWDLYVWYSSIDTSYWNMMSTNFNKRLKTILSDTEAKNIHLIQINDPSKEINIDMNNLWNDFLWKDNILWLRVYVKIKDYYFAISWMQSWGYYFSDDGIKDIEISNYIDQSSIDSKIHESIIETKTQKIVNIYKSKKVENYKQAIEERLLLANERIETKILAYVKPVKTQQEFIKIEPKIYKLALLKQINYRIYLKLLWSNEWEY